MELRIFQVDAFTNKIFSGNSACVVPLQRWLPDAMLLKIARENAVAETAFFVANADDIHLRWFTPEIEMDLCGHATLATAHVLVRHLSYRVPVIRFQSASGLLEVSVQDKLYTLDFPSRVPIPAVLPAEIRDAINRQPAEVLKARDYLLVFSAEEHVRDIVFDRHIIDRINLDPGGIIVTAPGTASDFVSRYFTPQASIFEDPVTGSAHCSLIPYWSRRTGKNILKALQLSERGGELFCKDDGDRVLISGEAVTYLTGTINIEI